LTRSAAAPRERLPLGLGVPPHPQQQRDEGQLGHQQQHAAAGQLLQPRDRGRVQRRDVVEQREQPVQRPVGGQPEQFLLARHVVVDRRFRASQLARQVLHARAVVAALVEHLDRAAPHARLHPSLLTGGHDEHDRKTDRMFSREL